MINEQNQKLRQLIYEKSYEIKMLDEITKSQLNELKKKEIDLNEKVDRENESKCNIF